MNRVLLVVSFTLVLVACMSMPPRAYEWTFWKKATVANENEVRKAMLECGHELGAGVPFDRDEVRRNKRKYVVKDIYVDRCMEKDGFRYTSELGTTCSRHPDTPECHLPIEQIPSRDISRRLNGVYCTKFPTADLCKP